MKCPLRVLLVLCATLFFAVSAHAQPVGSSVVKTRAGEVVSWRIVFPELDKEAVSTGAENSEAKGESESLLRDVAKQPREIVIRRNNDLAQITYKYDGGATEEIWVAKGQTLRKSVPNGSGQRVIVRSNLPDVPSFVDLSETDFPELAWIADLKPVREETFEGADCYVFESGSVVVQGFMGGAHVNMAAQGSTPPRVPDVSAWIDKRTGLPKKLISNGRVQTYLFDVPADPNLRLPQEFIEVLQSWLIELPKNFGKISRP